MGSLLGDKSEYRVICAVPEKVAQDKIQILKGCGVYEIIRTLNDALPMSNESPSGVCTSISKTNQDSIIIDEESGKWNLTDCYTQLANEILENPKADINCLILPVESGNSISYLSKILKQKNSKIKIVGVEPEGSVFTNASKGLVYKPMFWVADSYGNVHVPPSMDLNAVDEWIQVSDQDAFCGARKLIKNGIFAGVSSGAVLKAASKYISSQNFSENTKVMVILPDSSQFYVSTLLNDEYLLSSDLADSETSSKIYKSMFEKYRAASVEDLQLPAAISVLESTTLGTVLSLMLERDFSHIPIIAKNKKLVGYISRSIIEVLLNMGHASLEDSVGIHMHSFISNSNTSKNGSNKEKSNKSKTSTYKIITPETPLVELAKFFEHHSFAFVTDINRKFCLGVVTKQDLIHFVERRAPLSVY
ncbi:hypothetical protein BB560_007035 [Smittium megazygosporum]|uniref:CBS domain-containing protein n=1 Tax=Smittium megazygosporum TaxID=133381 RepID=A0A2T9XZ87_9FUNG|nr:hypothetical protein BB560_007035 [Smittium megazygosporum]